MVPAESSEAKTIAMARKRNFFIGFLLYRFFSRSNNESSGFTDGRRSASQAILDITSSSLCHSSINDPDSALERSHILRRTIGSCAHSPGLFLDEVTYA